MTLGEQIRKLRTNVSLTQQGLANRIGVSLATIQTVETDKRPPTLKTLLKIVRELKSGVEFEVKGAKIVLAEVGQLEKLVSMMTRVKR